MKRKQSESRRKPTRIYSELAVDGQTFWTLLDSGARGTYVTRDVGELLGMRRFSKPVTRGLGGQVLEILHYCTLGGKIEGYDIATMAFVVERLFPDEKGRAVEIILGMEALETWGIWLDTVKKRPDFTHYAAESWEG